MSQTSFPFTGTTTGDSGPYSAQTFSEVMKGLGGTGTDRTEATVFSGSGTPGVFNALNVQASSPVDTNINLMPGCALVDGTWYKNTAQIVIPVPANGSGNPRIDTLILRKDFANQVVRYVLKPGVPAGSPVAPALTQTAGVMWEVALADIAVANGFVSLAQSTITNRQVYLPAADTIILTDILNNSGATLNTGDVVVWDYSVAKAVKTSTIIEDGDLAGVWVGTTVNGDYGRLLVKGFGYVYVDSAVAAINTNLYKSTTAKQSTITQTVTSAVLQLNRHQRFATTRQTTGAAGLCFCYVDVEENKNAVNSYFANSIAGVTTSSYTFVDVDVAVYKWTITPKGKTAIFAITVYGDTNDGSTILLWDIRIDATNRYSGSAVGGTGMLYQGNGCLVGLLTNLVPGTSYSIYLQWSLRGGGGGMVGTLHTVDGILMEID